MMRASFPFGVIPPTGIPRQSDTLTGSSGEPEHSLRSRPRLYESSGAPCRAVAGPTSECGSPGTFYIHPWEMDDWIPSVAAPRLQILRTFGGRKRIWQRVAQMIREFDFGRISDTVEAMTAARC